MNDIETKLIEYQTTFDQYHTTMETDFSIENDTFTRAGADQLAIGLKWVRLHGRICSLFEEAKQESDASFADAYTDAMNARNKIMTTTEAKQVATCDRIYIDTKKLENRVFLLKKDSEAVTEMIETRKYILKDLVALQIHDSRNVLI